MDFILKETQYIDNKKISPSEPEDSFEKIYFSIKGYTDDSDDLETLGIINASVFPYPLYSMLDDSEIFEMFDAHSEEMQNMHRLLTSESKDIDFNSLKYDGLDIIFIDAILVDNRFLSKGIGTKLIQSAIEELLLRNHACIILRASPIVQDGPLVPSEDLKYKRLDTNIEDITKKSDKLHEWYKSLGFKYLSESSEFDNVFYKR